MYNQLVIKLFLPIFFLLFLIINLFSQTDFEINKDAGNHPALGNQLLSHNQLDEAQIEFKLANDNEGLSQVAKIKSQPEEIKTQIIFWEKIVAEFPNYRDAYLKLAILNYKINRLFDAKKYLDKALEIDPNNEVAKKLSSLL